MLEKMKSSYVIMCLVLESIAISSYGQMTYQDLPDDALRVMAANSDARTRSALAQTSKAHLAIVNDVRDQAQRGVITLHAPGIGGVLSVTNINVGTSPRGGILSQDGQHLFVMNKGSHDVSVIAFRLL